MPMNGPRRDYRTAPRDAAGKAISKSRVRLADLPLIKTTADEVTVTLLRHPHWTRKGPVWTRVFEADFDFNTEREALRTPESGRLISEVRTWARTAFGRPRSLPNPGVTLDEVRMLCIRAGGVSEDAQLGHVAVGMTLAGHWVTTWNGMSVTTVRQPEVDALMVRCLAEARTRPAAR